MDSLLQMSLGTSGGRRNSKKHNTYGLGAPIPYIGADEDTSGDTQPEAAKRTVDPALVGLPDNGEEPSSPVDGGWTNNTRGEKLILDLYQNREAPDVDSWGDPLFNPHLAGASGSLIDKSAHMSSAEGFSPLASFGIHSAIVETDSPLFRDSDSEFVDNLKQLKLHESEIKLLQSELKTVKQAMSSQQQDINKSKSLIYESTQVNEDVVSTNDFKRLVNKVESLESKLSAGVTPSVPTKAKPSPEKKWEPVDLTGIHSQEDDEFVHDVTKNSIMAALKAMSPQQGERPGNAKVSRSPIMAVTPSRMREPRPRYLTVHPPSHSKRPVVLEPNDLMKLIKEYKEQEYKLLSTREQIIAIYESLLLAKSNESEFGDASPIYSSYELFDHSEDVLKAEQELNKIQQLKLESRNLSVKFELAFQKELKLFSEMRKSGMIDRVFGSRGGSALSSTNHTPGTSPFTRFRSISDDEYLQKTISSDDGSSSGPGIRIDDDNTSEDSFRDISPEDAFLKETNNLLRFRKSSNFDFSGSEKLEDIIERLERSIEPERKSITPTDGIPSDDSESDYSSTPPLKVHHTEVGPRKPNRLQVEQRPSVAVEIDMGRDREVVVEHFVEREIYSLFDEVTTAELRLRKSLPQKLHSPSPPLLNPPSPVPHSSSLSRSAVDDTAIGEQERLPRTSLAILMSPEAAERLINMVWEELLHPTPRKVASGRSGSSSPLPQGKSWISSLYDSLKDSFELKKSGIFISTPRKLKRPFPVDTRGFNFDLFRRANSKKFLGDETSITAERLYFDFAVFISMMELIAVAEREWTFQNAQWESWEEFVHVTSWPVNGSDEDVKKRLKSRISIEIKGRIEREDGWFGVNEAVTLSQVLCESDEVAVKMELLRKKYSLADEILSEVITEFVDDMIRLG